MERCVEKLKKMDPAEKERIQVSANGSIEVITAFPVDEKGRREIDDIIQRVFSEKVTCNFKIMPELGFGIEIRSGGWKLGWSMKTYMDELRSHLKAIFDVSEVSLKQ
nr:F0F1 ATP synthase subunit delta [Fodinibius salsisoli]